MCSRVQSDNSALRLERVTIRGEREREREKGGEEKMAKIKILDGTSLRVRDTREPLNLFSSL